MRDEVLLYLSNNVSTGLLSEAYVFDHFIMKKLIDGGTVINLKSAVKIKFMVQRFEEDGFTSYWL